MNFDINLQKTAVLLQHILHNFDITPGKYSYIYTYENGDLTVARTIQIWVQHVDSTVDHRSSRVTIF